MMDVCQLTMMDGTEVQITDSEIVEGQGYVSINPDLVSDGGHHQDLSYRLLAVRSQHDEHILT
jgi:hypothetical protein